MTITVEYGILLPGRQNLHVWIGLLHANIVLFSNGRVFSSFGSKEEKNEEKLNIFSVASGHLYERFLKIMMLSVLKHTKTPVKFWFLKNYLSPQIKVTYQVNVVQFGVTIFFLRISCLIWRKSMVLNMSWCSISGLDG